jgi:hypothetical protein
MRRFDIKRFQNSEKKKTYSAAEGDRPPLWSAKYMPPKDGFLQGQQYAPSSNVTHDTARAMQSLSNGDKTPFAA